MARIRSVKPELRTSLVVAGWRREIRYTWVLLWGYLDDHGRGIDDPRLLKSDLYPLDDDVSPTKLSRWLDTIAKDGPLCRYQVGTRSYLHAVNWRDHQRISHPTDSRIPPCPEHETATPTTETRQSESRTTPERRANDSGTTPEPFRASRTRAEQGAGSREVEQGKGAGSRDDDDARAREAPQPPAPDPSPAPSSSSETTIKEPEPQPDLAALVQKRMTDGTQAGADGWDLGELVTAAYDNHPTAYAAHVELAAWYAAHVHDRDPLPSDVAGAKALLRSFGRLGLDALHESLAGEPKANVWQYATAVARRLRQEARAAG